MYLAILSATNRKWHKVNFKRITDGIDSEFTFSQIGCHSKIKAPGLLNYLPTAGGTRTFPKSIIAMGNATLVTKFIFYNNNRYITIATVVFFINLFTKTLHFSESTAGLNSKFSFS